jgi:hypothetical protein
MNVPQCYLSTQPDASTKALRHSVDTSGNSDACQHALNSALTHTNVLNILGRALLLLPSHLRTQRHSGEVFGASRTTHNIASTLQNLLKCSIKRVLAFVIAPPLILILRRARCPVNGVLPWF